MFMYLTSVSEIEYFRVRGNFSGEPSRVYILCACFSTVWSAESVQIYLGTLVVWAAGLYGFFFLFGPAVAGTVRLKW